MILLVKFAEARNVNPDTVTTYIRRHPEEFKGHTAQKGNKMLIDEVAEKILNEKYPLPRPIEIIEDKESREKLIKAQEFIIQLQEEYKKLQNDLLVAKGEQLLIEQKTQERIDEAVKVAEDKLKLEMEQKQREAVSKLRTHYEEEMERRDNRTVFQFWKDKRNNEKLKKAREVTDNGKIREFD